MGNSKIYLLSACRLAPAIAYLTTRCAVVHGSGFVTLCILMLLANPVSAATQALVGAAGGSETFPFIAEVLPKDGKELRTEAELLVKDLAEEFPNNPDALEVKARLHFLIGDNAMAKEAWQAALRLEPKYGYALHGLGKVALADSDFDSAVTLLKQAAELLPENPEPVQDLSDAYLKRGDLQDAIAALKAFTAKRGDDAETFLLLGQAQLADRQFEEAKKSFEITLELRPDLPRAQEGLGKTLLRLGDREGAKALLEAQSRARASAEATNRSAEEVFADECRDYSVRYLSAARVYLEGKAVDKAEKVIVKATVLDPSNIDAWTLLLSHYQAKGDMQAAVSQARIMCEKNPDNASCYFTSGVLMARAGMPKEAEKSFEKVILLAPNSPAGYESLARLLIGNRSEQSRTPGLAQMVVQLRGNAADHELLAQSYAVTGRLRDAHDALSRAIQLDPQNVAYQQAMQQLEKFRASLQK